jgi:hypothetical protein
MHFSAFFFATRLFRFLKSELFVRCSLLMLICLCMENASTQGDKGKRPTKATASARRAKAAENPQKKRSHKRPTELEAAETAHPEPQHGEGEPAQPEHRLGEGEVAQSAHHQTEVSEERKSGDDIVRDIEKEEEQREGVASLVSKFGVRVG